MQNNKTYAVINLTDVGLIDFAQVGESNASTIRKSTDETQFIIKWLNGYTPSFITDGTVTVIGNTMTHSECLELMDTAAWKPEEPE